MHKYMRQYMSGCKVKRRCHMFNSGLCLHIYTCTYICIYVYLLTGIHVYTYSRIYVCMHVYMYTIMHMWIYVYKHTYYVHACVHVWYVKITLARLSLLCSLLFPFVCLSAFFLSSFSLSLPVKSQASDIVPWDAGLPHRLGLLLLDDTLHPAVDAHCRTFHGPRSLLRVKLQKS